MYLHLNFSISRSEEYFPAELGDVQFGLESTSISRNNYYLNNNPLIDDVNSKGFLDNIQKVNLFVGANNSGKSRFLRSLFKYKGSLVSGERKSVSDYREQILQFPIITHEVHNTDGVGDDLKGYWWDNLNDISSINNVDEHFLFLNTKRESYIEQLGIATRQGDGNLRGRIELCIEVVDILCKYLQEFDFYKANKRITGLYIPILRSLISDKDLNPVSFNKVLERKFGLKNEVFTGLSIYNDIYSLHNSSEIVKLDEFCNWLKRNFYKDHNIRIIPDKESLNVLLQIDGKLTPIYDLGDGIQQLVLLMFPIYTAENNTYFFIEEPENHLHPGLQKLFMETLLSDEYLKNKNLRYFFTTHSNHFLDLSIYSDDISIFQFKKNEQGGFNIDSNIKPNRGLLDLLGVNSSSVFLANTSIWVEGPTDRRYLSKWLKMYAEENDLLYLREDIDFAFFEYGGNLIEHYLFDEDFDEDFKESEIRNKIKAFALSNKIYLLADNDNAEKGSAKYERREKLENIDTDNFKYKNTKYKEIENLLPFSILKDFMPELSKEVINIDVKFDRDDYENIGLGKFFSNLFDENNIASKKFKSKTGETLSSNYKNKLCDFVVNNSTYTYKDLIKENAYLNELIVELYNFIKTN
ncbi:ATP-dependent nuclease [Flavobacterium alkalisoli]|uniref:AAA family ATPase n=1 Tax=Flavobacterium alkalisoli TaxID=2602769 RepID=UPI003A901DA5